MMAIAIGSSNDSQPNHNDLKFRGDGSAVPCPTILSVPFSHVWKKTGTCGGRVQPRFTTISMAANSRAMKSSTVQVSGIQTVAILLRRMLASARLSSAMEVTCTE